MKALLYVGVFFVALISVSTAAGMVAGASVAGWSGLLAGVYAFSLFYREGRKHA